MTVCMLALVSVLRVVYSSTTVVLLLLYLWYLVFINNTGDRSGGSGSVCVLCVVLMCVATGLYPYSVRIYRSIVRSRTLLCNPSYNSSALFSLRHQLFYYQLYGRSPPPPA